VASRPKDTALREREKDWEALGFSLRFRRQRMVRTEPVFASPALGCMPRFAREEDLPAICALMDAAYDPVIACLPSKEALLMDIRKENVVVAEHEGSTAAFLRMTEEKAAVECRHLVVSASLRGRGIAPSLFAFFDRENGMRKNLVWVSTENASALRLYTKLGFIPDGWTSGVWVYQQKGNN